MKKSMTLAAIAAMMMFGAGSAMAQYAPQRGDLSTEVQFNPFSNNFQTFRIDGLSARYFVADKHAIRATLNLGMNSNTTRADLNKTASDYDKTKDDFTTKDHFNFGLGVGYEYHLLNSGRTSLYVGGQLGFDIDNYSGESEAYYKSGSAEGTQKTTYEGWDGSNVSSANIYGQVFTGIDFYLYKNLYVGAELGLKLASNIKGDYETSVETPGAAKVTNEYDTKNEAFSLNTYVTPGLRLGWKF